MNVSIQNIDIIIRNELITQSGLSDNLVRAADSLYGTDLDENTVLQPSVWDSITQADSMLLFSLLPSDSVYNLTEQNGDDIELYQSYTVHCILYGDNSLTLATSMIGRMRSEEVRDSLQSQGVCLNKVSNATKLRDFINGAIWTRVDFDIEISCQSKITTISTSSDFADYASQNIQII